MMATLPALPGPSAAPRTKPSTRASSSRQTGLASRSSRRPASSSRPSVDLAGRTVALSADVPSGFDVPLGPHHKMIGRWVAATNDALEPCTRQEARVEIERVFTAAVHEILRPVTLVDLRVVAFIGEEELPPAIAIICDSIGQIDLGWIEKTNVLSNTLSGSVAPVGWRAAAYRALDETLRAILPVGGYADLFEEVSMYYWDGDASEEGARQHLIDYFGDGGGESFDESMLPSAMNERRQDYMTTDAAPLKDMAKALAGRMRALREAHKSLKALGSDGNAWLFDTDDFLTYNPDFEDAGTFPQLTVVPFEHFARELDDVARHGMEQGFMDMTGICQLTDPGSVGAWFASLRLGVDYILAAQALIDIDPTTERG